MAIRGCLLKMSSPLTGVDYQAGTTALTFDTEVYDTHGFHSGSGSKIIIPASMNGLRGVFTAVASIENATLNPYLQMRIFKNGSYAYNGAGGAVRWNDTGNGQNADSHWVQISTAPVLLTTGDEWEFLPGVFGDAAIDIVAPTSFGLYVYGSASGTIRCATTLSGNLTSQNFSTPAAIPFAGADIYDTHAAHDPASNNTKIIIPSAANGKFGVFAASAQGASVVSNFNHSLAIRKNGSFVYDGFGGNSGKNLAFGYSFIAAQGQVHQLTTGDEYELVYWTGSDSSITLNRVHDGTAATIVTTLGMWVYD